ncbi:MAG: hypothetical protein VB144_11470 [Clostridia bacterium]|nr:hypothetical protein [Clostridia bacterium]
MADVTLQQLLHTAGDNPVDVTNKSIHTRVPEGVDVIDRAARALGVVTIKGKYGATEVPVQVDAEGRLVLAAGVTVNAEGLTVDIGTLKQGQAGTDPWAMRGHGFASSVEAAATATTSDANADFAVKWISHIVNDGGTDLYIAFDASSATPSNRLTLKSGEVLDNFPRTCSVLHYSCKAGTCAFRAVGVA